MKTISFTFPSKQYDCGVLLYSKETYKLLRKLPFRAKQKIGNLNRMTVTLEEDYLYQFYEGEKKQPDPKGRAFVSPKKYGQLKSLDDIFTVPVNLDNPMAGDMAVFDWEGTENPQIPYENAMVYCMHVRGFTKHSSSKVKAPGTFAGVMEKIPYLKETGVTTLEFQPIYEFVELCKKEKEYDKISGMPYLMGDIHGDEPERLNYWGYTKGYYYAPKQAYASDADAVTELRTLIRELHRNGMEAVLQFYFPKEVNTMEIPEILRFWVMNYHVDGFHLMGENLPVEQIAKDPILAATKLWYYWFDENAIYEKREVPEYKNLALVRDDYLYDMRKFLRGDESCVPAVMHHFKTIPVKMGCIHYMSNYCGFTLMDLVSYETKHNQENGEENRDGGDYHCSWNCGVEGSSRKKKILKLRRQQLKNIYAMLFFSQSTPRIFMGDEFGNSQQGNNNPYCQDNDIAWLNWNDLKKNEDLYAFFTSMAALRREHPILHPASEAKMMDYISCGFPDLSYHGETAWRPRMDQQSRQLGVMYCGQYARKADRSEDQLMYLAMNMHWEDHELALPRLSKMKKWELVFATCEASENKEKAVAAEEKNVVEASDVGKVEELNKTIENPPTVLVPARSMTLYIASDC